jgi:ribosomal protein L11 methyltransferase
MDYIELNCELKTNNLEIARELLTQQLADIGYESFIDTDTGITAYIIVKDFKDEELNKISILSGEISGEVKFSWSLIKDQNWNQQWESNFSPVIINSDCYIRATFHEPQPGYKYEIVIEPKMSFGTGHHETTSLMMENMMKLSLSQKQILDMGSGTGILSVLASMLGAASVTAIDIDEWAYNNALENIKLNHISNIEVIHGDKACIPDKQFDIILANINRNILLNDMPSYFKALKKGGELLLSGIYVEDIDIVNSTAQASGFKFMSSQSKNKWACVLFSK